MFLIEVKNIKVDEDFVGGKKGHSVKPPLFIVHNFHERGIHIYCENNTGHYLQGIPHITITAKIFKA
jgi:hypothetical protein